MCKPQMWHQPVLSTGEVVPAPQPWGCCRKAFAHSFALISHFALQPLDSQMCQICSHKTSQQLLSPPGHATQEKGPNPASYLTCVSQHPHASCSIFRYVFTSTPGQGSTDDLRCFFFHNLHKAWQQLHFHLHEPADEQNRLNAKAGSRCDDGRMLPQLINIF